MISPTVVQILLALFTCDSATKNLVFYIRNSILILQNAILVFATWTKQ